MDSSSLIIVRSLTTSSTSSSTASSRTNTPMKKKMTPTNSFSLLLPPRPNQKPQQPSSSTASTPASSISKLPIRTSSSSSSSATTTTAGAGNYSTRQRASSPSSNRYNNNNNSNSNLSKPIQREGLLQRNLVVPRQQAQQAAAGATITAASIASKGIQRSTSSSSSTNTVRSRKRSSSSSRRNLENSKTSRGEKEVFIPGENAPVISTASLIEEFWPKRDFSQDIKNHQVESPPEELLEKICANLGVSLTPQLDITIDQKSKRRGLSAPSVSSKKIFIPQFLARPQASLEQFLPAEIDSLWLWDSPFQFRTSTLVFHPCDLAALPEGKKETKQKNCDETRPVIVPPPLRKYWAVENNHSNNNNNQNKSIKSDTYRSEILISPAIHSQLLTRYYSKQLDQEGRGKGEDSLSSQPILFRTTNNLFIDHPSQQRSTSSCSSCCHYGLQRRVKRQGPNLGNITFFYSPSAATSSPALSVMRASGMSQDTRATHDNVKSCDWTLWWAKGVTSTQMACMSAAQKVNHFPGTWALGRKDNLNRHLMVQFRKFGQEHYGFFPKGYLLPRDRAKLKQDIVAAKKRAKLEWKQYCKNLDEGGKTTTTLTTREERENSFAPSSSSSNNPGGSDKIEKQQEFLKQLADAGVEIPGLVVESSNLQTPEDVARNFLVHQQQQQQYICGVGGVGGAGAATAFGSLPPPRKNPLYIFKRVAGACGRGMKVITKMPPGSWGTALVQEYIDQPLLVNGFKFDLRIYVVVTSFNPLRCYVYREGLARFATSKYPTGANANVNDRTAHLTNFSVNRNNKNNNKNSATMANQKKQNSGSKRQRDEEGDEESQRQQQQGSSKKRVAITTSTATNKTKISPSSFSFSSSSSALQTEPGAIKSFLEKTSVVKNHRKEDEDEQEDDDDTDDQDDFSDNEDDEEQGTEEFDEDDFHDGDDDEDEEDCDESLTKNNDDNNNSDTNEGRGGDGDDEDDGDDGDGGNAVPKWTFEMLHHWFRENLPTYSWDLAWSRIDDVIIKTLLAAEHAVTTTMRSIRPRERYPNCFFELFGFDVLLKSDLNPVLMEVNIMCSLESRCSPLDQYVKGNMLADCMSLVGVVPLGRENKAPTPDPISMIPSLQQLKKICYGIVRLRSKNDNCITSEQILKEFTFREEKDEQQQHQQEQKKNKPSLSVLELGCGDSRSLPSCQDEIPASSFSSSPSPLLDDKIKQFHLQVHQFWSSTIASQNNPLLVDVIVFSEQERFRKGETFRRAYPPELVTNSTWNCSSSSSSSPSSPFLKNNPQYFTSKYSQFYQESRVSDGALAKWYELQCAAVELLEFCVSLRRRVNDDGDNNNNNNNNNNNSEKETNSGFADVDVLLMLVEFRQLNNRFFVCGE